MSGGMFVEEISYVVKAVVGAVIGFFGWKLKKIDNQLCHTVNKTEVREIVDDKIKHLEAVQKEISKDINRMEGKLDRLIERNLKD